MRAYLNRALVVIDPNNPTGATYPADVRRALIEIADRHNIPLLADEVYGDLAYDGPVAPMASLAPDAPIISFSSLSKAYLAPGWRTVLTAIADSTPQVERRFECMAKVVYNAVYHVRRVTQ